MEMFSPGEDLEVDFVQFSAKKNYLKSAKKIAKTFHEVQLHLHSEWTYSYSTKNSTHAIIEAHM